MNGEAIFWTPGVTLAAIEKQVIYKAYQFYRQNKTATATALGISIKTLDNKFDRYEQEDKAAEDARKHDELTRQQQLHRARFGTASGGDPIAGTFEVPSMPQADQGNGAQPPLEASEESAVSMPVGKKVQEMLPESAPPRRKRRAGS